MKILFFISFVISMTNYSLAQIELNIVKHTKDSFEVFLVGNPQLEMNKNYQFVVKTNITKNDSLKLIYRLENNPYIEDNLLIEFTSNSDIKSLSIEGPGNIIFHDYFIHYKGAKYEMKIDNTEYSEYNGGNIGPFSKVDIEFKTDLYNIDNFEIKDPIIITTYLDRDIKEEIYLKSNKCSFQMNKLKNEKFHYNELYKGGCLLIIFPQAYLNGIPIFSIKEKDRTSLLVIKY
jgi:hypothetical protein